jgi:hypothetical protein
VSNQEVLEEWEKSEESIFQRISSDRKSWKKVKRFTIGTLARRAGVSVRQPPQHADFAADHAQ